MNSGSGEAHVVEPNLISLLDLVMQLLMFFIMCVTFVTDQAAAEISLPDSQAAAPIEDKDTNVQIVNIRPFNTNDPGLIAKYSGNPKYLEEMGKRFQPGQVYVIVSGQDPMSIGSFRNWLRDQHNRATMAMGQVKKSIDTTIIIRAHKDTDYKDVYNVLELCRNQGYSQLVVRVLKV
ncbi:MAG: biopolymer transporter ExbD [Planctomycetota bacterium]|nr:biopolymer transporter ExbD [Planctomycetota bacterium]